MNLPINHAPRDYRYIQPPLIRLRWLLLLAMACMAPFIK